MINNLTIKNQLALTSNYFLDTERLASSIFYNTSGSVLRIKKPLNQAKKKVTKLKKRHAYPQSQRVGLAFFISSTVSKAVFEELDRSIFKYNSSRYYTKPFVNTDPYFFGKTFKEAKEFFAPSFLSYRSLTFFRTTPNNYKKDKISFFRETTEDRFGITIAHSVPFKGWVFSTIFNLQRLNEIEKFKDKVRGPCFQFKARAQCIPFRESNLVNFNISKKKYIVHRNTISALFKYKTLRSYINNNRPTLFSGFAEFFYTSTFAVKNIQEHQPNYFITYKPNKPRKLIYSKHFTLLRWQRLFKKRWKIQSKFVIGGAYSKENRIFVSGRKLFTLLTAYSKNNRFQKKSFIGKQIFRSSLSRKKKKIFCSLNSLPKATKNKLAPRTYTLSTKTLPSTNNTDSFSIYTMPNNSITSAVEIRSSAGLPFGHRVYNRKERESLISRLRGSSVSFYTINALSLTRFAFEVSKKAQDAKREKLRKADQRGATSKIIDQPKKNISISNYNNLNPSLKVIKPFKYFSEGSLNDNSLEIASQKAKHFIFAKQKLQGFDSQFNPRRIIKRKQVKNSATFLKALNKERTSRYRYIGIYIPDLIRIAFLSLYGKHAQLLISFFAFIFPKLPRNRKETKFMRFLIKVAKLFAAQRPEITGLRLAFQGRVNRWRRTKQINAHKGTLPLHTIALPEISVSYGLAQSINRKGALGRRLWMIYNSSFVIDYKKNFFSYLHRIK